MTSSPDPYTGAATLTAAPVFASPRQKPGVRAVFVGETASDRLAEPGIFSPAVCSVGGFFPVLGCERFRPRRAGARNGAAYAATADPLPLLHRWLARGRCSAYSPGKRTRLARQVCRTVAQQVARPS